MPRLLASGTVTARGRRYEVRDAPAYHDRNWGRFAWGGGCAWEWATIIPADPQEPWSLVPRIIDRRQAKVLSQSLMVWRSDRLVRKFYGPDLKVERRSALQLARPLRIPTVAALALPGSAADVPRYLDVVAAAYADELHLQLTFDGFAQVVFTGRRRPGLTALSECPGTRPRLPAGSAMPKSISKRARTRSSTMQRNFLAFLQEIADGDSADGARRRSSLAGKTRLAQRAD